MSVTPARRPSIEWITLDSDHSKVIARPTLNALRALLEEKPAPELTGELIIRLVDFPSLDNCGGIARASDAAVGIARIGRESFVAFTRIPGGEEPPQMVELVVAFDEVNGTLAISAPRLPR